MDMDHLNSTAHDMMKRARGVLFVAHRSPDGDTLGAVSALARWCDREGVPATRFCLDRIPPQYLFLHGAERFVSDPAEIVGGGHDLIVVCDCGDLKIAGVEAEVRAAGKDGVSVINLDHHASNVGFGHLNVVDAGASSTCEMAHRLLVEAEAEICHEMATALLTGIVTDTENFSNPATSRSSIDTASELLRRGARLGEISRNVIRNKSVESLRLWGLVLSRLKYDPALGMASTAILADDLTAGTTEEHIVGVSNFLNSMLDAKVTLVLREMPDGQVRGSLRSVEGVDVSTIAKKMGGGGHQMAAGFSVKGKIVEYEHGWQVV
ncbi:MAG: DHH family phosphoesterase [bacterium]